MKITEGQPESRLSPDSRLWLARSGTLVLVSFGSSAALILVGRTPLENSLLTLLLGYCFIFGFIGSIACVLIVPFVPLLRWLQKKGYEHHSAAPLEPHLPEASIESLPASAPIELEASSSAGQSEFTESVKALSTNGKLTFYFAVGLTLFMTGFLLEIFVDERVLPELARTVGRSLSFFGLLGLSAVTVGYVVTRFTGTRDAAPNLEKSGTANPQSPAT